MTAATATSVAAGRHLSALNPERAERIALRGEALRLFKARYRHNPESQRAMVGGLRRIATRFSNDRYDEATFPWELLVDEDLTTTLCSRAAEGYARATAVKDASALRVMLKCLNRVGAIGYEELRHASNIEVDWGSHRPRAGHYLSEPDIADIVTACAHGATNAATRLRDGALVLTLASTGARGDEAMGALVEHVDLPADRIWLHRTKSGVPRDAWLHPAAADAITRWLEVRGTAPGPVFVPLSRTGRPLLEHGALSVNQARKVVRRRAAEAGHSGIGLHDLRRFVISTLLERGVDIALVAKVVGHQNPATTARYDTRGERHLRDAVAKIDLPRLAG